MIDIFYEHYCSNCVIPCPCLAIASKQLFSLRNVFTVATIKFFKKVVEKRAMSYKEIYSKDEIGLCHNVINNVKYQLIWLVDFFTELCLNFDSHFQIL